MRILVTALIFVASLSLASMSPAASSGVLQQQNANGWQLPDTAKTEKSPLTPTADVLKKGKSLFESKCQRCHGPEGKGNGPDADPEHKPDDLSDSSRAAKNPDGVMFYKIWNGRKEPKMPALKTDLSQDEVWAIVEYAKTLRK